MFLMNPKFSWSTYSRPILCLAPMDGYTDSAFRQIIKTICPTCVVFSEMCSTDALAYGSKKTLEMLRFNPRMERPYIVQLFGKNLENFSKAAKTVADLGADGIDLNMGCSVKKVFSSGHGAALRLNSGLAAEIVLTVKNSVKLPVSVKTRLGENSAEDLIEFCLKLQEAGADCLIVHGRTIKQMFQGQADWQPIYTLKKHLKIPVIGNGDVKNKEDAQKLLGNLDGIMVGRATVGNPWVMGEIEVQIQNAKFKMQNEVTSSNSSLARRRVRGGDFQNKIPLILQHAQLAYELKGQRGILEMRKHLVAYFKGIKNASDYRAELVRVQSLKELDDILEKMLF
ncbi:dihydrouridine synthase [Candidatus Peregrinibacteria bacterium CG08_land_8_20_14_0_20_41_10]|nr:MAG: dihydrouridine synthase [Candidatus Peregrinibacteria bacterium CG08_land_8_20_14_0_20_41_10]